MSQTLDSARDGYNGSPWRVLSRRQPNKIRDVEEIVCFENQWVVVPSEIHFPHLLSALSPLSIER